MGVVDSFDMRLVDVRYFVSLASMFQSCGWHVLLVSMGELLIVSNAMIFVGARSQRVLCGVQEGVLGSIGYLSFGEFGEWLGMGRREKVLRSFLVVLWESNLWVEGWCDSLSSRLYECFSSAD